MYHFIALLLAFLVVLFGAVFWALRYLLEGRRLLICRTAAAFFGLGTAAAVLLWQNPLASVMGMGNSISFISVLCMTELFLAFLVLAAVFFRALYRRILAVPEDAGRRRLLAAAGLYPAASLGAALYGNLYERTAVVERYYDIPVAADSLSGYTVAQLSDVHLGMFFSLEELRSLLEQTAAAAPQALLLTGDVFDHPAWTREAAALIGSFTASFPDGIWYCHGNHEHLRGIELVEDALAATDIRLLTNCAQCVREVTVPLYFAGVDYPMEGHRKGGEAFLQEKAELTASALAQVPGNAVTVLLAHHPEFIDDAAEYGVRLVLTGHTHGSQFGLFGLPLLPVFKYTRGIVEKGRTTGYVHSGNGSWFPCRIGCPPEIAYFTLRA